VPRARRDVAVTLPLISRLVPHFGERPEDLPTTLFETAPTILFTVPRYLQRFAAQVLLGIRNSGGVKRTSAEIAMHIARAHARRRWNGAGGLAERALYRACRAGVFLPILNKLGFDRLELVVCARAPTQTMRSADVRHCRRNVRANPPSAARPVAAPGRRRNSADGLAGQARKRRRSAGEEPRSARSY
jgi:long-subunit acyl-CoA synthetase (AMP-forming)